MKTDRLTIFWNTDSGGGITAVLDFFFNQVGGGGRCASLVFIEKLFNYKLLKQIGNHTVRREASGDLHKEEKFHSDLGRPENRSR